MAILSKINPAVTDAVIAYVAPAGRNPLVNMNVANVSSIAARFSIGIIKSTDSTLSAVTVADGGNFTGIPTLTVGGVHGVLATVTVASMKVANSTAYTVVAAGSGYTVGGLLTVTGGTGTKATLLINAIGAGGAIASVSLVDPGAYSVLPTAAAATTCSGAGTGATVSFTWGISAVTVTAAGTGYSLSDVNIAATLPAPTVTPQFVIQLTPVYNALLDTYHPTSAIDVGCVVERTGISLGAGDMLIVKASPISSVNFITLGYEDLA